MTNDAELKALWISTVSDSLKRGETVTAAIASADQVIDGFSEKFKEEIPAPAPAPAPVPTPGPTIPVAGFYGDSTTAGYNGSSFVTTPEPAEFQLQTGVTAFNHGKNSTTTSDWLNGNSSRGINQPWAATMAAASNLTHIFINLGINDYYDDSINETTFSNNLISMVRVAKNCGKTVFLQTPNPVRTTNGDISGYANIVRQVANATGAHLVDKHQFITNYASKNGISINSMLADVVHPNQDTYTLIGGHTASVFKSKTTPREPASPYGQDAGSYVLTFEDLFDSGFDTDRWNDHIWYQKSHPIKNYEVEDSKLKIWPVKDSTGVFPDRTIDTDGKFYQKYGYFEVEAKLPVGKGTWPAFWLFNHIGTRRPEIDIMEAYAGGVSPWGKIVNGQPHPTAYGITIWRDAKNKAGFKQYPTPDLSAGFHKYGLKWEPNKQTFYFDGKESYSVNVSMSDEMYLMLDLWYGSASGEPDNTTPTGKNNSFEIEYVRAWKFK